MYILPPEVQHTSAGSKCLRRLNTHSEMWRIPHELVHKLILDFLRTVLQNLVLFLVSGRRRSTLVIFSNCRSHILSEKSQRLLPSHHLISYFLCSSAAFYFPPFFVCCIYLIELHQLYSSKEETDPTQPIPQLLRCISEFRIPAIFA